MSPIFARALAATVLFSSLAVAQETAAPSPLQVTAKLIVVPTVVRDKHGALVAGLKREDFSLQVDGKPQVIRYFDHDSDVPLTVGLLIDTSMSQREVLDDERTASSAFLDKMLAPDRDKAFIIQFAHDVNLMQDVTTSRPKLQEALKQIDADKPAFGHGHDHSAGGTALYDSVFLSADEVMSKQTGRRALILLTDGDDNGSLKTLPKAIEAAQRADAIVYAIYYHSDHGGFDPGSGGGHHGGGGFPGGGGGGMGRGGGGFPGGGGGYPGGGRGGHEHVDGKKVLMQMCGETGGRVFEVKGKETVEKIYTEIGEELRSQYRLGFTPSAEAASEGYHPIELTLSGQAAKGKEKLQTRDGYYQK